RALNRRPVTLPDKAFPYQHVRRSIPVATGATSGGMTLEQSHAVDTPSRFHFSVFTGAEFFMPGTDLRIFPATIPARVRLPQRAPSLVTRLEQLGKTLRPTPHVPLAVEHMNL